MSKVQFLLLPTQRTTHSNSQIVWSAIALLGLLIGLALWLVWSPSPLRADSPARPVSAQSRPQALIPLNGIAQVAAGGLHTCALTTAGGVKCWGNNSSGQLGDGSTTNTTTPVDVVGLGSAVTAIAIGNGHTCALSIVGGVKCWGGNGYGQLGDGTMESKNTPVDVVGLSSGVAAIDAGNGAYTCALTTAGGVKCWGHNGSGQLGDGTMESKNTPVDVVGLSSGATAINAGSTHTCALTMTGGVKCWGRNNSGQLGDGTSGDGTSKTTPVDVVGLGSGMAAIVANGDHTCALTTAGGVKCWGNNGFGQLGDGTMESKNTPVDVVGLGSDVTSIVAGVSHTCALTTGGGIKCWGANGTGQLGDGTTGWDGKSTPVDVVGLGSGAAATAAGYHCTCALTTTGGVKCWGNNNFGQLGDGTTADRNTPVDVVQRIEYLFLPAVQR